MMEEFVTACPRNCYSTCSFRVQVENNRIRRILPYSENLATPEGPCIKGLSYIERTTSPDRIIHPLIKTSSGKFNEINIDDALDIISTRLGSIKEKYGSQSILWYKGSGMSGLTNEIGYSFWKAFGGTTTTYGNLCWPAGLEAVRLTLGSVKHNVPWDLKNAKTIIIWGKNPAETNIQEVAFIAGAKEKGCKIIVIDPFRTPTADKADMLFCPKPGTDGALALAIARVLIINDLIDYEFIRRNVKGFDELNQSLQISPAEAELITGIPAENIVELAHIIGNEGPVTIIPGYGLQRHQNGGQTIRSILLLSVLTGNIGKPGSGFNYANLQSYIFDDLKEPLSYYPDTEKDLPFRKSISMAKLGSDMLTAHDPELKAVWIERGNPLLQSPDTNSVKKAFSTFEFNVVVEQFMTDTAALADIILPANDMFEQSDIIGSYWSPYIQFKPKVIQSPGDVLPESEIYFLLAKRLNLNISFELIPEPGNINIEKWLEKRISGYSELTLKDLKKAPVLAPGLQQIAWEDLKFETQSGKIERQLSGQKADIGYSWFPNKNLDPAIEFTAGENNDPLRIIPENIYKSEITKPVNKEKSISGELSLIVFSFLTTLSVATLISSIFRGVYPERTVFIPVIVLAGLASFFHLGKRLRSWRSVSNLKNSPLSREIAFYLIYSTLSSITVFFQLPVFLIISSVIGLVLLILIDSVYIYADKRKYVILHSGQTFLSALLIVSFLSGAVFPFIFIAIIKLVASLYSLLVKKMNSNFEIRFLRIAFLIVTGFSLISHNSYSDLITISIFLTGEFFDRIIFYIDFNPLNINALINSQLNIDRDEKKRGK